jgi:hypothetical protein
MHKKDVFVRYITHYVRKSGLVHTLSYIKIREAVGLSGFLVQPCFNYTYYKPLFSVITFISGVLANSFNRFS